MFNIVFVCALGGIASFAFLMITIISSGDGSFRWKWFAPSFLVFVNLWSWVFCYYQAEPQYEIDTKTREIHETVKEDGQRVQWFYNYNDNYEQLEGLYDNKETKEVIVTKRVELPMMYLYPKFDTDYYHEVKDKQ